MASLDSLIRWHDYPPDIGDNRSQPRPFTVQIAVGLTKTDLRRIEEAAGAVAKAETPDAAADALAAALGEWVRLGPEPLTVAGQPIDSLAKLIRLYTQIASGAVAMLEIATALRWFNSAGGHTQLFFERLSGGSVSTTSTGRAAR